MQHDTDSVQPASADAYEGGLWLHDEMIETMNNTIQPGIDNYSNQLENLLHLCCTLDREVANLGHALNCKIYEVNRSASYIHDCNVRLRHMEIDYERLNARVQELEQNQNSQSEKITQLEARMQELSKTMEEQHQRHCRLVSIDFDNDRKRLQQLELSVGVILNLIQCGGDKSKILPPLMPSKGTPVIKNI